MLRRKLAGMRVAGTEGGGGGVSLGTFTIKRNLSANLVVTESTQNLGFSERAHNKDRRRNPGLG